MNCKHKWKESENAKGPRKPNEYVYECQRCNKYSFAVLNSVSAGSPVVHAGGDQQAKAEAQTKKEKAHA